MPVKQGCKPRKSRELTVVGQSDAGSRSSLVQGSTFLELPVLHIHRSLEDVLPTFRKFCVSRVFVSNDMIRLEVEDTLIEVTRSTSKVVEEEAV